MNGDNSSNHRSHPLSMVCLSHHQLCGRMGRIIPARLLFLNSRWNVIPDGWIEVRNELLSYRDVREVRSVLWIGVVFTSSLYNYASLYTCDVRKEPAALFQPN